MKLQIETPRLRLISCDVEILNAILIGDEAVSRLLQISTAVQWTEFGGPPFRYSLDKLSSNPEEQHWWTYLPILKSENILIGSGGYKGKPSADGMVEIAYEISESYRNRGLATEMAQALIKHAFRNKNVSVVCAHTLPEENASVNVLRKAGMSFTGEIEDEEDGKLWRWEITRLL